MNRSLKKSGLQQSLNPWTREVKSAVQYMKHFIYHFTIEILILSHYLKPASRPWQFFARFCSFTFIIFLASVSLTPNILSSSLNYPSHITASLYFFVDLSPHSHLGLSISEVYSLMCKLVRPIWITIHSLTCHKKLIVILIIIISLLLLLLFIIYYYYY